MIRLALLFAALLFAVTAAAEVRIKDVSSLRGMRHNQLVGYGLVVGLNGTGDGLKNSPFTEKSLKSMLDRIGVNIRDAKANTRNVAAVIVTAALPPFVGTGSRIDVTVSSLGDATSLAGGTLIITPLHGADGEIYAVGQGPLIVSGFAAAGNAATVTQGTPTAARVPNGALVERELSHKLQHMKKLVLDLNNPDFHTAIQVVDAINAHGSRAYGKKMARENDHRSIALIKPANMSTARFLADIGSLTIEPDTSARVIVDERTGTVIIGKHVNISPVAITHGNLNVRVSEEISIVQPNPFSDGVTAAEDSTEIVVQQETDSVAIVSATSLETLVNGLNQIGVDPKAVIAILQGIKSAGALQADLIVQ